MASEALTLAGTHGASSRSPEGVMQRDKCSQTSDDVDVTEVLILEKGNKHCYTVPSFPVMTAMLREVKLCFNGPDGREVFDGYARECDLLNRDLPSIAQIESGYSHAFIIKVHLPLL